MGLLDAAMKAFSGGDAGEGSSPGMAGVILQMLQSNESGGLNGLVQQFQSNGLGQIMQSWISTGQNLPISPEQIQQVLGSGQIQKISAKLGISPDAASAGISSLLPLIIDKVTPNGDLSQHEALLAKGMDLLRAFGASAK